MSEESQKPPAGSMPPAGVPTKSGSGLVWIALVLLVAGGGGVYFRTQKSADSEVQTETKVTAPPPTADVAAKAAAELNDAPPPPPPEEPTEVKPDPSAADSAKTQATKSSGGCSGTCQGAETPALVSAIRATAGQARNCYNRALRLNTGLEGKMTASVRVGPNGAACQVNIVGDTLNDAGVRSCVTQMFRANPYPAPQGGCVQIDVPLNFVAK